MSKSALITGATGGIGESIAKKLAKQGYDLQLHYHQNQSKALQLQEELMKWHQVEVTLHRADLSSPSGVEELLKGLHRDPDILIHNAGLSHYGLITEITHAEYTLMMQILLTSPFQLTQGILPSMIAKKWGRIVFVTSIWGETGAACETLYSMGKGGLIALAKALAKEVAPSGITVNAVSPGVIDTAMMSSFEEEVLEQLYAAIPLGRMGNPHEVAHTVSFLLDEDSSYITGQIIRVNGGWYT